MSTAGKSVFDYVAKRHLIYNACWEDPALDRQALSIGPDDTLLAITSAGCNVLDYALCGPRHVFAVDSNPHQNALLGLRISGIRTLEHEDFFRIFGEGVHPEFESLYMRFLRPGLSPFAQRYWDTRTRWFSGEGTRNSFYLHALAGWVALFCCSVARHRGVRGALDELLTAGSIEEQRSIWDDEIAPHVFTPAFEWALSREAFMTMMGVPKSQSRELHRSGQKYGAARYIRESFERVIRELPIRSNYFWQLYMRRGSYTRDCCPEYLTERGFGALKAGLVDRISLHDSTVTDFLRTHDGTITKFVLLDHMDWMNTRLIADEWRQLLRRAGPSSRAIFRSVYSTPTLLEPVEVRTGRGRERLTEILAFDRALAGELHPRCRVGTYRGFFIANFGGVA